MKFHYIPSHNPRDVSSPDIDLVGLDEDDHLSRNLAKHQTFYELDLLEAVAAAGPVGGTYVDVGANIGNHSVFFGLFLADHLIAIEPNTTVSPVLRRNLELNIPGKFTLLPYALGATPGSGLLRLDDPANVGRTKVVSVTAPTTDCVPIERLDDLVQDPAITFIKIDVEGAELDVLHGATRILAQCRPQLAVELLGDDEREAVEEFLRPFGYQCVGDFCWNPTFYFIDPARHHLRADVQSPYGRLRHQLRDVQSTLSRLVPPHATVLLIDDRHWADMRVRGITIVPFPTSDNYWGPPPDDTVLIAELARLRANRAGYVLVAETAFWWLDYFSGLAGYLNANARLVHHDQKLMLFALSQPEASLGLSRSTR